MAQSDLNRRTFVCATGIVGLTALAGCTGGSDDTATENEGDTDSEETGGDGSGDDGSESSEETSTLAEEPDYDGWFEDANNYEATVDLTGEDAVTITVGYEELGFDPAAVAVSPGTTVTWEWNGNGGSHNVASPEDGPLESETVEEEGHTYEYTFEEAGTFLYQCDPHAALGMKGAVYIE